MTVPVILLAPPTLAGHLATAIGQHRVWLRRCGYTEPAGLADIEGMFRTQATARHCPPADAPLLDLVDAELDPLVATYEETARVLKVSERTVSRLVASGDLPAVRLGGSARVRVADLHQYVQNAPSQGGTAA